MAGDSFRPTGDDNMEISSDAGQNHDGDIEIDFDDLDNHVQEDHPMLEQTGNDEHNDDEMNDDIDYNEELLDDPDEELEDAIGDELGEDVEVADAEPHHLNLAASQDEPSDLKAEAENTSTEYHTAKSTAFSTASLHASDKPFQSPPTQETIDVPTGRQIEDEQKHQLSTEVGPAGAEEGQHSKELQGGAKHDASPGAVAATEQIAHEHRAQSPPSVLGTAELLKFPVTLRFAGTDNNLFPVTDVEEGYPPPGYLLGDRNLMKEPLQSVFDAFRDRFGEAIPASASLGLEFPNLDLGLNEEHTFAADAGCCLLNFIELYVKLSRNDGDHDPSPFALYLNVEDKFYSRYQFLRDASNQGKGLSQVVQIVEHDESFEEGDDEYDGDHDGAGEEGVDGDQNVEVDYFVQDEERADEEGVEEYAAGDEPYVEDEQHEEQAPVQASNPHDTQTPKNEVGNGQASAHEEASIHDGVEGSGDAHYVEKVETVNRKSSDARAEAGKQDVGQHDEVNGDGNVALEEASTKQHGSGVSPGSYTSSSSSETVEYDFELIWDDDADEHEAPKSSGTSPTLTVNEFQRAHEDEEDLIDYSDEEEAGDANPTRNDETGLTSATASSPGSDKKRKRAEVDESMPRKGDPSSKAAKRHRLSSPTANAHVNPVPQQDVNVTADITGHEHGSTTKSNVPLKKDTSTLEERPKPEEEEDLFLDFGDEEEGVETLPSKPGHFNEEAEVEGSSAYINGTDDDAVNGNVTITGASAAKIDAPADDDEEELINYGSDFDVDTSPNETNTTAASSIDPVTAPASEVKSQPPLNKAAQQQEEEEDLIDYSSDGDDDTLVEGKTT